MNINVNLKNYSYNISVFKEIVNIYNHIKDVDSYSKIVIITDENIYKLYFQYFNFKKNQLVIKIKPGEKSKNINQVMEIINQLADINFSRNDLLISLGGGVVGDISGLVSSIYMRGVDFIQVPTTLLSMVDSSVGGKNGIDTKFGKNLIGTFKQPKQVIIFTDFLKTLDNRQLNNGFAEVIKHSLLKDSDMFSYLVNTEMSEILKNIDKLIFENILIKVKIVEDDEFEKGDRVMLNFGHTIGHAIEVEENFENILHGEAIAIGMYQISKIAYKKGIIKNQIYEDIKNVLIKFNLPYKYDEFKILEKHLLKDKKQINNKINYILVDDIGEAFIYADKSSFIL